MGKSYRTTGCRWHSITSITQFPNGPGCYAIYLRGKLVYIGSAVNLYGRFYLHQCITSAVKTLFDRYGHEALTFKYRDVAKYGDWAMVELRLIYRLQPELNKQAKRRFGNRPIKTRGRRYDTSRREGL